MDLPESSTAGRLRGACAGISDNALRDIVGRHTDSDYSESTTRSDLLAVLTAKGTSVMDAILSEILNDGDEPTTLGAIQRTPPTHTPAAQFSDTFNYSTYTVVELHHAGLDHLPSSSKLKNNKKAVIAHFQTLSIQQQTDIQATLTLRRKTSRASGDSTPFAAFTLFDLQHMCRSHDLSISRSAYRSKPLLLAAFNKLPAPKQQELLDTRSQPPRLPSALSTDFDYNQHTASAIIDVAKNHIVVSRAAVRSKKSLVQELQASSPDTLLLIHEHLNKRKRDHDDSRVHKRPKASLPDDLESSDSDTTVGDVAGDPCFLSPVDKDVVHDSIAAFIDATSNSALTLAVCAVCAGEFFRTEGQQLDIDDIPNGSLLRPSERHPSHALTHNMLLEPCGISNGVAWLCDACHRALKKKNLPPASLANGLWVGEVPLVLRILSLAERMLIARYFPAAYIVKMFPKKKGARNWDSSKMNSKLQGNVSTYPLSTNDISHMVEGKKMPQPISLLPATIGITFVGPKQVQERMFPDMLHVSRERVHNALLFLKENNPLWSDIEIDPDRLKQLPPISAVPQVLLAVTRQSDNVQLLNEEHDSYVPEDSQHDSDDPSNHTVLPSDTNAIRDDFHVGIAGTVPAMDQSSLSNDHDDGPGVTPMRSLGVVDVCADDVPNAELLANALHALGDPTGQALLDNQYVQRGSQFVNEYQRVGRDNKKNIGTPLDPNHLLGAFPTLFPFGMGGFEVDRTVDFSYEKHAKWCLRYHDKRFRKDLHFAFQVFGVLQKRQVCRSASIQIKKSAFVSHKSLIVQLKPNDLLKASFEEDRRVPFTNPSVRELRKHLTATRANVQGTDESRAGVRSLIWGMSVIFNPPSVWMTINPSDNDDPIAQILTGAQIDMDNFVKTAGPDSERRGVTIASDPYAATKFFHILINAILQHLFGFTPGINIHRRPGALGTLAGYIGTVEAQGRGTLHLHIILWLSGAPSFSTMKDLLKSDDFRSRVVSWIDQNIRADLDNKTGSEILSMPTTKEVSYSRTHDPRKPDYIALSKSSEQTLARTLQRHECDDNRCLKVFEGRKYCKRRAPFATAPHAWIDVEGNWGPKRIYAYMNTWCPPLLQCVRANQDIKLMTNGSGTKDAGWYITSYATKKQTKSSNTSALLAKRLAFHRAQEKQNNDVDLANKRLIQRCANALTRQQEFSAPEVMGYLMGYGDRYVSHHFVKIYTVPLMKALRKAFPNLQWKPRKKPSTHDTDNGNESNDVVDPRAELEEPEEETIRMEIVNGVLTYKDQIKEYVDRGGALSECNYLKYFTNTYDSKSSGDADVNKPGPDTLSSKPGRMLNARVPYKSNCGRNHTTRIIRTRGHETLPNFIGPWFPRNDDSDNHEFYCAMMLALLAPWQDLQDLMGPHASFEAAFVTFMGGSSKNTKKTIDNIQFYYECSDAAKKNRNKSDQVPYDEHTTTQNNSNYQQTEPANSDSETTSDTLLPDGHQLSEADIDAARLNVTSARETLFGLTAMMVAYEFKIFLETVDAQSLSECTNATHAEVLQYAQWAKDIKKITRSVEDVAVLSNPLVIGQSRRNLLPAAPLTTDPLVVSVPPSSPDDANDKIDHLNVEQRRAHDIVINHLKAHLAGRNPPQLLMIVTGQGGTGKSTVIEAITQSFRRLKAKSLLAKMALSGVAASLIGGKTLHDWAGIPVKDGTELDWTSNSGENTKKKRSKNLSGKEYALNDEFSMMPKSLLAKWSQIVGHERAQGSENNTLLPFGGMNVVLFGDLHQFPPVKNSSGAVYVTTSGSAVSILGREIFEQFTTVVALTKQMRVTDQGWTDILNRSRVGGCSEADLYEISKLVLSHKDCVVPDFQKAPWNDAVLVTSRHGVRQAWNDAALIKHAVRSGNMIYLAPAEDVIGSNNRPLTMLERLEVAGMTEKKTGKLPERVHLCVGMKAMVTLNLQTEADLSNGTRGVITDIVLDIRETASRRTEEGFVLLDYPPAAIMFQPDKSSFPQFSGLPEGVIPVFPKQVSFKLSNSKIITRRQVAVTPGYAFTDYKSQGQTIEYVIVDLMRPPTGALTPFNAYVALSRSRGRNNIRLLRDFDETLFTQHPSHSLSVEDDRLRNLTLQTEMQFASGMFAYSMVAATLSSS